MGVAFGYFSLVFDITLVWHFPPTGGIIYFTGVSKALTLSWACCLLTQGYGLTSGLSYQALVLPPAHS